MIARIWHGYTSAAKADAYEKLLREEIFVGISSRQGTGFAASSFSGGKLRAKSSSSR